MRRKGDAGCVSETVSVKRYERMEKGMTVDELRQKIKACDTEKPYIFVSYKRADADKVYPLVIELQKQGVNVWIDKEMKASVGKDWQKPAFDAMYECECRAILLFVSENSLSSAPVLAELAYSKEEAVCDSHDGALPIYSYDLEGVIANEEYRSISKYVSELKAKLIKSKTDRANLESMFPKDKLSAFWEAGKWPADNLQIAKAICRLADIEKDTTIVAQHVAELVETFRVDCPGVFVHEIIVDPPFDEKPTEPPVVKPEFKGELHEMLFAFMDKYNEQVVGCNQAVTDEEKDKYRPGKSNWLYNMVCKDVPALITKAISLEEKKYACDASVGAGKWAGCPWIAVFNRYITYSVTQGVYVVYLLNPETKELYLTLNQGETQFGKIADEKGVAAIRQLGYKKREDYIFALLKESTAQIRSEIGNGDFSTEEISTGKEGYDFGCVCSRKYSVSDLPADDVLISDLKAMLQLYDRYFELHQTQYASIKTPPKKERKSGGKVVTSIDGKKVIDKGLL